MSYYITELGIHFVKEATTLAGPPGGTRSGRGVSITNPAHRDAPGPGTPTIDPVTKKRRQDARKELERAQRPTGRPVSTPKVIRLGPKPKKGAKIMKRIRNVVATGVLGAAALGGLEHARAPSIPAAHTVAVEKDTAGTPFNPSRHWGSKGGGVKSTAGTFIKRGPGQPTRVAGPQRGQVVPRR